MLKEVTGLMDGEGSFMNEARIPNYGVINIEKYIKNRRF